MTAYEEHLRAALEEAGDFPCFAPDEHGDPCACCLHVTAIMRAALTSDATEKCPAGHREQCCGYPVLCEAALRQEASSDG